MKRAYEILREVTKTKMEFEDQRPALNKISSRFRWLVSLSIPHLHFKPIPECYFLSTGFFYQARLTACCTLTGSCTARNAFWRQLSPDSTNTTSITKMRTKKKTRDIRCEWPGSHLFFFSFNKIEEPRARQEHSVRVALFPTTLRP